MLDQTMLKTAHNIGKRNQAYSYLLHQSQRGVFVELKDGSGFLVTPTATIKLTSAPGLYKPFNIGTYVKS